MNKITKVAALACLLLTDTGVFAREIIHSSNHQSSPAKITASCSQTTAQKDLDFNNVRARIFVGGDMWWDLVGNAQYEVPKGSGKTSSYAASVWVGGLDAGGNIKAAAQNYRQTGNDYWGGPIQLANVSITSDRCNEFDKQWKIRKQDVGKFRLNPDFDAVTADEIQSKQDILSWPGNGGPGEDQFLAPFYDSNNDGIYDPRAGDYPAYNFSGTFPNASPTIPKVICNDYLFGDQTIWWVFNDVGGIKTNTNSEKIGLEIRAQAFEFKTNDEINNMTFYKYQIINRSSQLLTKTYFGKWADCDLGYYKDDYVRCNVKLGLGMTYNGDLIDDLPAGYGATPPAIGIDFFQGPLADIGDGIDNDRDGLVDSSYVFDPVANDSIKVPDTELQEQIIMSKFVYYINSFDPIIGEPLDYKDYYNYLRGVWKNGAPMTYGGNGYSQGSIDSCDFMFPALTDPKHQAFSWTEEGPPADALDDRRMLESAGPFTLQPGAVNYITVGVVWARATSGDNLASLTSVEQADIKAQALFDNCFKTLDGPDAPDLVIRELDKELLFSLQNTDTSITERYNVIDHTIINDTLSDDQKSFKFQGYQVYQLKSASGNISDLEDHPDDIKLIFQCDIKDGITDIVNYAPAANNVYTAEVKVGGANKGISHTFKIDKDFFAVSNSALVNHKNYYYTVVAYAYNNYQAFDPQQPLLGGQLKPYLAGRNNIITYSAIPHIVDPENGGTVLNSVYGDGPVIKRIEGQGNGGNILDFTQGTIDEILNSSRSLYPEYVGGKGPIDVKVYDPVLVKGLSFTNRFDGVVDASRWTMIENGSGTSVVEDTTISYIYEQVLSTDHKQKGSDGKDLQLNWGISANIHNVFDPGKNQTEDQNGFLEATISYQDNSAHWLNFLPNFTDATLFPYENWIKSSVSNGDTLKFYENVLGGTWAPLKVTKAAPNPGANTADSLMVKPPNKWLNEGELALSPGPAKVGIASIDIVFTPDQSKWSRAAVIEMGHTQSRNINNAFRFDLRKSASIDKNGNMNYPSTDNNDAPTGMGWFPGYAYNLETGERLNIVYGENSADPSNNGTDMKFNPTETKYDANGHPVFGGMHYIYVFGHNFSDGTGVPLYDGCKYIHDHLWSADTAVNQNTVGGNLRKALWKEAMWVSIPMLAKGKFVNQTEAAIRLRVAKRYRRYNTNIDANTYLDSSKPLTIGTQYYVVSGVAVYNTISYTTDSTFTPQGSLTSFSGSGILAPTKNGGNPLYEFSTNDLAAQLGNADAAKDALKLVNIVPNPYYAYSAYEGAVGSNGTSVAGQLDNRIKIVNLPAKCTISIFTMHGTLVKRFIRDAASDNSEGGDYKETSVDWDLKNTQGIAIASGIYLIHVDAGTLGQRTLKWFGVLRPIDVGVY